MKTKVLSLAFAFVALFTFSNVYSQNPHFNRNSPPVVTDAGTTACASGTLHGLGNYAGQNVQIQIFAEGTVYTECENPAGNVAPGQNSTTILQSEVAEIPVSKNGRATFSNLCTNEPNVTTQSAGCPNSKWTGRAADVVFTKVWMVVGGKTIDLTPYM